MWLRQSLQQATGSGRTGESPLHHLAAAQSFPDAGALSVLRVRHWLAASDKRGTSFGRAASSAR